MGVRISANAAKDAKEFLRNAGLGWNGVARLWTGKVDEETAARLRERFGDRLETRNSTAPSPVPVPDQP